MTDILTRGGWTRPLLPNEFAWTDERIETLKAMWADGETQADIATTLGCNSRGAVSGKIARLGLPLPTTKKGSAQPRRVKRHAVIPERATVAMPVGRLQFLELTGKVCHFPVGDAPPFLFCGEPTTVAPYCASCFAIATYKPGAVRSKHFELPNLSAR